jgi:purine-binding chemotaxis protein CheW
MGNNMDSPTSGTAHGSSSTDPGNHGAPVENQRQFITFTLDSQEYGIDIMVVREIKGWSATTSIPNSPPHVRGVMNLRGVIVPIFDLRARFGLGTTDPTRVHVIVIVSLRSKTIGLLVDAVSDIISIAPDAVRPVPEMGLKSDDKCLDGLVSIQERMVTLVSLEGLFASLTSRLDGDASTSPSAESSRTAA